LLEYVLDKDVEDTQVKDALAECESYPPRVKLLESLREDGTWPIPTYRKIAEDSGPGPPYGWTYITMLRNLYMLYEYCVPKESGHIEAALDRMLSWQHEDGYIQGPELDGIPRPHYNGLALGMLLRFGMEKDPRTDRLAHWLLGQQRHDGGWNIRYLQDVKYLPEYRNLRLSDFVDMVRAGDVSGYDSDNFRDVPSCIWSSVGALRGLAWDRIYIADKRVARGGSFVLDRFFKRNYHANFFQAERNWTMLKYPTFYGSGLTALDVIAYLGFNLNDQRMEKPTRWLLNARRSDGLWHRSERPHPIDDQWISVTALMVLHYISKSSR
jgi:hypothetical protein